jgi:23S rRNA (adenine-N6)-dimethyltransferase
VSADRRRADLSQHFLRNGATAARLVRGTTIAQSDLVVEIGAGRGALTQPLSQRARALIAIEVDPALTEPLAARFAGRVDVVRADFLDWPLPRTPYKAFGNVPFARTTDIIRKLTAAPRPPDDAWLVVQREAAQRFCGHPYVAESLWSLRLKPDWHVEIVDRLRRADFDPPPSVESVLLWRNRRDRSLLSDSERRFYVRCIELAFSAHRSMGQTTRTWLSKIELQRLGRDLRFAPDAPPSTLAFEQWLGIVRFVERTGRFH